MVFTVLQAQAQTGNSSPINIQSNDSFEGFEKMLGESAADYRVFFTGENHRYYSSNQLLEMKMFRYLHDNEDVDVFLFEFGAGAGYLINKYVETGDSTYLEETKHRPFIKYQKLFKALREYWVTLEDDNKFKVEGIDREASYELATNALVRMLPTAGRPHDSIVVHVDALRLMSGLIEEQKIDGTSFDLDYYYDDSSERNSFGFLLGNFKKHRVHYQSFLGDDFASFEKVLIGVQAEQTITRYEVMGATQSVTYREEYMYQQFLRLAAEEDNRGFYGQFGRCHVTQSDSNNWCEFYTFNSLSKRISRFAPGYQGKVMSIGVLYGSIENTGSASEEYDIAATLLTEYASDSITMIEVTPEEDDLSYFDGTYQYLIINNYRMKRSEVFGDLYSDDYMDYDYYYLAGLDARVGIRNYDFGDLTNRLFPTEEGLLESQMVFYGGSIVSFESPGFYYDVEVTVLESQKITIENGGQIKLSGFQAMQHFGGDLTSNSTYNIIPSVGVGFARFLLQHTDTIALTNNPTLLGGNNKARFNNPAFIADARLDLRLNANFYNIGIFGGYTHDFSSPYWRHEGRLLRGGVKTKHSGWYAGATLGIVIKT